MQLSDKALESNRLMIGVDFGLRCAITGRTIHVNDIVHFIHNDVYSWHTFRVCYCKHASKFYLSPVNFEDKPISLIQQYLGCDGNLYENKIVLVNE